jgi:cyclopropane fatty-acyl-phospholipid synthase-like methyltransferase
MFEELEKINTHPEPFEFYTASDLWTDEHTSEQMLTFHLKEDIDVSSRKAEFINRSVEWIASHFNVGAGTKIADFGCGPGLYATRLAQRQADVTAIDFSKRSIQYAQEVATRKKLAIHYVNLNTFKYEEEKVVLDKYTLIEASHTRTVYNWLQYFSPDALEREFVECGFTIEKLYSDVAGSPFAPETTEIAIVAKRL